MVRILSTAGLRLLACAAIALLLWKLLGAVGLAVSAPLFGVALAGPILELVAHLPRSAKAIAYSEVQGKYYEHRGFRVAVIEDEMHLRWLSVRDVRKVIPDLPREAVLQRSFRERLRHEPAIRGQAIRADALLAYLVKSTTSDSIKLRIWLERDVILPAQRIRRRLGIEDTAGTAERSDRREAP